MQFCRAEIAYQYQIPNGCFLVSVCERVKNSAWNKAWLSLSKNWTWLYLKHISILALERLSNFSRIAANNRVCRTFTFTYTLALGNKMHCCWAICIFWWPEHCLTTGSNPTIVGPNKSNTSANTLLQVTNSTNRCNTLQLVYCCQFRVVASLTNHPFIVFSEFTASSTKLPIGLLIQ
jgi:hypothetical protein